MLIASRTLCRADKRRHERLDVARHKHAAADGLTDQVLSVQMPLGAGHMVWEAPWSPSFDTAIRSNGFGDLVLKSSDHRARRALSPLDHCSISHDSGAARLQ
jgi:hypothetical protein